MSIQQVSRRLIANGAIDESKLDIDVTTGEQLTFSRSGNIIFEITDTTALTFRSVGGYSHFNMPPSSIPSTVASGDLWMDSTTGLLYQYNSTLTKWVSIAEHSAIFAHSQSGKIRSTLALSLGTVSTEDGNPGYLLDRDIVITSIAIHRDASVGAMDIEIRRDDSAATLVTKTLADTVPRLVDNALNVNASANSWLQCYTTNNSANDARDVTVVLKYRYRR